MSQPADPLAPIEPPAAAQAEVESATMPAREPAPPVAAEGYDPVELRRRMAVCFSGPELRELAESLGVAGSVPWDRGPSEAARDLIRQFEKYYGLGILVAKLRDLRPLVEWPDPEAPAIVAPAPKTIADAPPPSKSISEAPPPPPKTIADAPFSPDDRDAGPTIVDPMGPSFTATSVPRSQVARTWPGTSAPAAVVSAPPRGIDPRLLIVVAGLTVLAAVIAYAAGRASRPPVATVEAAGSAAPVASTAPRRAPGPATRAADVFRRSLDRVVRGCDLVTSPERDAAILGLALAHCGFQIRTPLATQPPPLEPVILDEPRAPPPTTRPKGRPAKDPGVPRDPATVKADGCLAVCESDRRTCNDHCGTEPLESSLYDGYMRCRSRCLSAASHCRLACQ